MGEKAVCLQLARLANVAVKLSFPVHNVARIPFVKLRLPLCLHFVDVGCATENTKKLKIQYVRNT